MSSTAKRSRRQGERTGEADRAKLDATTDADIARQIAEDPDTVPDVSGWDLAKARKVKPLYPAGD